MAIQYKHSRAPYLEAASSICKPWTRHVGVDRDPLNMGVWISFSKLITRLVDMTQALTCFPHPVHFFSGNVIEILVQ
jgi:hypothetical protein